MPDELRPEKPILGSDGSDVIDEEHDFLADTPGESELGYETQEFLRPTRVFGFVVFLVIMAGSSIVGMWFLERYWAKGAGPDPNPSPFASDADRLANAPPLQAEPGKDMAALREEESARVNTYGWIDRDAGRVHIPVERAMDLILEEGLPYRGETPTLPEQQNAGAEESAQ